MPKPNAAVIALLALAVSVLGALMQNRHTLGNLQLPEGRRLLAADWRILIPQHRDALLNDPASPIAGNPQGDVTIVSFLDYNCPHCERMDLILQQAVEHDPNLRIVRKQFPVLGPPSQFAARAALALANRENMKRSIAPFLLSPARSTKGPL
ncbi:thioredoxin domain-containing protein [Mesorhizobium onobrychidis]|uniref:thioredoxin domain-containing protein n=1 Tax=Mesorhizobium onobrychidis TaxID=2775404 RepID=UPI002157EF07|nr:thioredoxin domain-containing protein [Mesorhizobium onobrychidis]